MTQVWPGFGEAPVPSLVSMICKPDAVVMAFPVCAAALVAIAAATPTSMVERMVRREDRMVDTSLFCGACLAQRRPLPKPFFRPASAPHRGPAQNPAATVRPIQLSGRPTAGLRES